MSGGRFPAFRSVLLRPAVGALVVSYVAVALVGALYTHPVVLLCSALVLGSLSAAVARSVHRVVFPESAGPSRGAVPAAATAALLVPFAAGVDALGEAGGYVVVGFVLLSGVLSSTWQLTPSPTAGPPQRSTTAPDPSTTRALLRGLCHGDLMAEWRGSTENGHPTAGTASTAAVVWRQALLEEIRRRDPQGFEAWLLDDERRGLEHHISGHHDTSGEGPDAAPR